MKACLFSSVWFEFSENNVFFLLYFVEIAEWRENLKIHRINCIYRTPVFTGLTLITMQLVCSVAAVYFSCEMHCNPMYVLVVRAQVNKCIGNHILNSQMKMLFNETNSFDICAAVEFSCILPVILAIAIAFTKIYGAYSFWIRYAICQSCHSTFYIDYMLNVEKCKSMFSLKNEKVVICCLFCRTAVAKINHWSTI